MPLFADAPERMDSWMQVVAYLIATIGSIVLAYIGLKRSLAENTRISQAAAVQATRAKNAADTVAEKQDALADKVDKIEGNTNGRYTAMEAEVERARTAATVGLVDGDARTIGALLLKYGGEQEKLIKYIHERNHDMLGLMETATQQSRVNNLLLRKLYEDSVGPLPPEFKVSPQSEERPAEGM